ncbi:hypothetical protein [Salimicrobium flavidum]|uniref:Uncharacterized protein n=1 Tax=Salimicrobium flavidum TaxID=570947 RepID=A0A1N7J815_9BACI|nr:hypothetical protein [Salimicrobium flavidum]SIS45444.1 hypothetical protein SAMN05421687_104108 [Salimicrobium flavidum]
MGWLLISAIVFMMGSYFVMIGLWELKLGKERKKFIVYMLIGVFLTFVLPYIMQLQKFIG